MDDSAFKAVLDKFESTRICLDGWLSFWTWCVVVGVALELVFIVWAHIDERHDWYRSLTRGIVFPPEKPNVLKLGCELFSVLLVVGGIVGELRIDAMLGNLETKIRGVNERRVLKLQQEAGDAAKSAHDAAQDATNAKDDAGQAKTIARDARQEADSSRTQAIKAENDLQASLERTRKLEAQLAWRTVTPEQEKAIKEFLSPRLRSKTQLPFSGVKIRFVYLTGDAESGVYAEELASALHKALEGIDVNIDDKPMVVMQAGSGPPATGLFIGLHSRTDGTAAAAALLYLALKSAGIDALAEYGTADEMTIEFFVGLKPRTSGPLK
jgi:hypothetical protein